MNRPSRKRTSNRRLGGLAAVFVLASFTFSACGADSLPPELVEEVGFLTAWFIVYSQEVAELEAFATTSSGDPVEEATVEWSIDDISKATIQQTLGLDDPFRATVTPLAAGDANITATVDGVSATLPLKVTDMMACSHQLRVIRAIAAAQEPGFCLNSSEDVFLGPYDHSVTDDLLPIPDYQRMDDEIAINLQGGMIFQAGVNLEAIERELSGLDYTFLESEAGWTGAPVVALFADMRAPIPQEPAQNLDYALVLDWDRELLNNYIPPVEFEDDHAQDGDFLVKISYALETTEWSLSALDLSTTDGVPEAPREVELPSAAVIQGSTVAWFFEWDGDDEGPEYRITTFWHQGDFGLTGLEWRAGYHPDLGTMASFPLYNH